MWNIPGGARGRIYIYQVMCLVRAEQRFKSEDGERLLTMMRKIKHSRVGLTWFGRCSLLVKVVT